MADMEAVGFIDVDNGGTKTPKWEHKWGSTLAQIRQLGDTQMNARTGLEMMRSVGLNATGSLRAKKQFVLRGRRAKNPRHPLSPVVPAMLVPVTHPAGGAGRAWVRAFRGNGAEEPTWSCSVCFFAFGFVFVACTIRFLPSPCFYPLDL